MANNQGQANSVFITCFILTSAMFFGLLTYFNYAQKEAEKRLSALNKQKTTTSQTIKKESSNQHKVKNKTRRKNKTSQNTGS